MFRIGIGIISSRLSASLRYLFKTSNNKSFLTIKGEEFKVKG